MRLAERLRFWLWYFWLEHPFILVAVLSVGFALFKYYPRAGDSDFWDGTEVTVNAEIMSFAPVRTRMRSYVIVKVKLEDGKTGEFGVNWSKVANCREGLKVKLDSKENRLRPSGPLCVITND